MSPGDRGSSSEASQGTRDARGAVEDPTHSLEITHGQVNEDRTMPSGKRNVIETKKPGLKRPRKNQAAAEN